MKDLSAKIDEFVLWREKSRQNERTAKYGEQRSSFYVSEIGKCPRKIAYEFFGLPKSEMNARTLRLLENGNYLQARYSDYFKQMGVLVNEEVSMSTADDETVPFVLAGRLDMIINQSKLFGVSHDEQNLSVADLAIVEMKSINTWGFRI